MMRKAAATTLPVAATANATSIPTDDSFPNTINSDVLSAVIGLNDLPLELVAIIADFVHEYPSLCAMMLVSYHLHDGVSLSRRWQIVNEVLAHVQDEKERRKILFDREQVILYASRLGHARILRLAQITREEAYTLCLPMACLHGHLEYVRYLVTEFDIKEKVMWSNLLPERLSRAGCDVTYCGDGFESPVIKSSPFNIACACPSGLPLVKFFHEECGVSQPTPDGLCYAASAGRLATIQYLHSTFDLTAADARNDDNMALFAACTNGFLPTVQYLHTAFGLTADDARNGSLLSACEEGQLPVVKYLHEAFGLTAHDAYASHALEAACGIGNLPLVEYLCSAFGLTSDDLRDESNIALRVACKGGYLPVVQFLHVTFNLTVDDARSEDNCALRWACGSGHLPVVQYLHEAFGLTVDDVRFNDRLVLRFACDRGHLPVVLYLHSQFGLTVDDVRGSLIVACEKDRPAVVQYFLTAFGFSSSDVRQACEDVSIDDIPRMAEVFKSVLSDVE